MQITISLPEAQGEGYEAVKHFLRQVELSVHHAQKSLEEMNKINNELDDPQEINVTFRVKGVDFIDDDEYLGTPNVVEIELYTM